MPRNQNLLTKKPGQLNRKERRAKLKANNELPTLRPSSTSDILSAVTDKTASQNGGTISRNVTTPTNMTTPSASHSSLTSVNPDQKAEEQDDKDEYVFVEAYSDDEDQEDCAHDSHESDSQYGSPSSSRSNSFSL